MISDRYALPLFVVVALALVPTVLHSYLGEPPNDGRKTSAIPSRIGEYSSVPTDRDAGWGSRRFESPDWFERRYIAPTDEAIVTVLRSYDLKRLYHHPELDVAYGTGFMSARISPLPGRSDIPMHVLTMENEPASAGFYVLQYGDRFIDDPVALQIRTAFELLVSRRQEMTLFFVLDKSVPNPKSVRAEDLPAAKLLAGIVTSFNTPASSAAR